MLAKHCLEEFKLDCQLRRLTDRTIKGYYNNTLNFLIYAEKHHGITEVEEVYTLHIKHAGIADDTVICLSSDHFPYGLDYNSLAKLYGYRVNSDIMRDHSRLILWSGCLEKMDPIVVDTPTFSLDVLPTLSNLFGTEFDSRLMAGRDVFSDAMPLVYNVGYDWKTEYGTFIASSGKFYPADESAEIPEGYVDSVKAIVRNKILFGKWVLDTDYYRFLFGNT